MNNKVSQILFFSLCLAFSYTCYAENNSEISIIRTFESTKCTIGELYLDNKFIGHTLELPWRHNQSYVSNIPAGKYAAFIKYKPGKRDWWRVQLKDTNPRTGIQIHMGNVPSDIEGCVLVGDVVSISKCEIRDSKNAHDRLRNSFYGVPDNLTPNPSIIDPLITGKDIKVTLINYPSSTEIRSISGNIRYRLEDTEWKTYFGNGKPTRSRYKEIARNREYILIEGLTGPHSGKRLRLSLNGGPIEVLKADNKWDTLEFRTVRFH